jgi:hypothetical protein
MTPGSAATAHPGGATGYHGPGKYTLDAKFDPKKIPKALRTEITGLLEDHLIRIRSLPFIAPTLDLDGLTPKALEALSAWLDELQVWESRRNCAAFVEYALSSERDGTALTNGDHHNEWHEFFDTHDRAVLLAPVEHAKSSHIGVGRVLHTLGRNPNARLALISNSADMAEKLLKGVRENIESNPKVRRVFPGLRPSQDKSHPWNASQITVQRTTIARDPSVQALGVGGPIVGSRLDGIVLDDVLNFENTRTDEQMQKMLSWYETTVMTRATDGAFIHVIGTPWHPRDLLHELERRPVFTSRRYSAILNPDDPQEQWIPLWPEQFSRERLIKIYNETTATNFSRKYLCRAIAVESQRFRQEWIDACLRNGKPYRRFPLGPLRTQNGSPLVHFTGVDLAMGKNEKSDLSVIFTIAIDQRGRKIVVDIQSGRWAAPELIDKIRAVHQLYNSQVLIEDNGAQAFLLQFAADLGVPAKPFTTTSKNKYDERYGVESLAIEVRNGEWVFPSGYEPIASELHMLFGEMLTYSPQGHTGDRLMAMWFAREGARHMGMGIVRDHDTLSR